MLSQSAAGDLALGQGGGGERVAIRVWPAEMCTDQQAVTRCLNDARASASVANPAIPKVVQAGMHGDRAFVAAAYDGGEPLDVWAKRSGRLSSTQVAAVAKRIADAMAAAHGKGLIHRDLRPGRILVTEAGDVRVLDFGCNALAPTPKTADAAVYSAPERWTNPQNVDPRADVYALGCIAFELATGSAPFHGGSLDELRAQHLSQPAPGVRAVMPDLPPGLEHLLQKMMSKTPADRPKAIAEVARAFEVLGGGALATSSVATTEAFQEALSPAVMYGSNKDDPPDPLRTRVGEIGNDVKLPPPSASISSPALRKDPEQGAGSTMMTKKASSGPSTTLILIIGLVVAVAVVVGIMLATR